jgi:hypothetical protein
MNINFPPMGESERRCLTAVDEYFYEARRSQAELNKKNKAAGRSKRKRKTKTTPFRRKQWGAGATADPENPASVSASGRSGGWFGRSGGGDDPVPDDLVTCPICLREFSWSTAAIRLKRVPNPVENLTVGLYRQICEQGDTDLKSRILREIPQVVCPGEEQDLLPLDYNDQPQILIAVVGPTGSSKSTYLAALIKTLREHGGPGFTITEMKGGNHDGFHLEVIKPIFEEREAVDSTLGDNRVLPVCYRMASRKNPDDAYTLVFVDVAGEEVSDKGRATRLAYLAACDGVIALVDPGSIPSIANIINDPTTPVGAERPELSLDSLISNQRDLAEVETVQGRLTVPVAVAVAKSDTIAELRLLPSAIGRRVERSWLSQSDSAGWSSVFKLDRHRFDEETRDVVTFLMYHSQEALLNVVSQYFWDFSFHFMSATNCGARVEVSASGDSVKRYISTPAPRRVLHPLLSVLDRLGVLDPGEAIGSYRLPGITPDQKKA